MDCHMPVMDGYAATIELRKREGSGSRTPVIALTAGVLREERSRCLDVGMDDFVSKPVDPDTLAGVLAQRITSPCTEIPAAKSLPLDGAVLDPARVAVLRGLGPLDGWGVFPAAAGAFLDHLSVLVEELRIAVGEGDLGTIGELAHKLRGGAANLGASRLAESCRALEGVAHTNDHHRDLPSILARLESELGLVETALGLELRARAGQR